MLRGRAPHAVLLVGPAGIGKTTLATDLAAGLLCVAPVPAERPCGDCRGCRLVRSGGHPDVHVLGPEGPGRQVLIGGPGKARGVRDLIADLALLPVEGGARVAIITSADRMNEDAQAALLKTLEEPAAGVTLILCADGEESILPTIRSRAARIRLGPVPVREIEAIISDQGVADAPTAARTARIAAGRPGLALAWAQDPEALLLRDELSRSLLDLLDARPAGRLQGVRAAAGRAARLSGVGDTPTSATAGADIAAIGKGRGRRGLGASRSTSAALENGPGVTDGLRDEPSSPDVVPEDGGLTADPAPERSVRAPATERRRGAEALIDLWTDLARDLALAAAGRPGALRDLRLLDDTTAAAARIPMPALVAFLDRIGRASVLIRGNVAPELVLDDLALAWPRPGAAA